MEVDHGASIGSEGLSQLGRPLAEMLVGHAKREPCRARSLLCGGGTRSAPWWTTRSTDDMSNGMSSSTSPKFESDERSLRVRAAPEKELRPWRRYFEHVSRLERITSDPAVCHGQPTIRGLRYTVESVLELLSAGMTIDDVLADYPDLERDDILAALEFGARAAGHRVVPLAAA